MCVLRPYMLPERVFESRAVLSFQSCSGVGAGVWSYVVPNVFAYKFSSSLDGGIQERVTLINTRDDHQLP